MKDRVDIHAILGAGLSISRSQAVKLKHVFYIIIGVAIIAAGYFYVQDRQKQEQLYRTRLDVWTTRLSQNAREFSMDMHNVRFAVDAYQIQSEIQSVVPPARYRNTHIHLQLAVDSYVHAIEAIRQGNYTAANGLLKLFTLEIQAAQKAYN